MTRPLDTVAERLSQHLGSDIAPPESGRWTIAQGARLCGVNPATFFRWGNPGILRKGVRVRCGQIRVGGRWMVTPEQLADFFDRLNTSNDTPEPTSVRSPSKRNKAAERASAELEKLGI